MLLKSSGGFWVGEGVAATRRAMAIGGERGMRRSRRTTASGRQVASIGRNQPRGPSSAREGAIQDRTQRTTVTSPPSSSEKKLPWSRGTGPSPSLLRPSANRNPKETNPGSKGRIRRDRTERTTPFPRNKGTRKEGHLGELPHDVHKKSQRTLEPGGRPATTDEEGEGCRRADPRRAWTVFGVGSKKSDREGMAMWDEDGMRPRCATTTSSCARVRMRNRSRRRRGVGAEGR